MTRAADRLQGSRAACAHVSSVLLCALCCVSMQAQPCTTVVAKAGSGQARNVYLVGDDASLALQTYLDAAAAQGVAVSLWKMRVTLNDGTRRRQVSMSVFDMVNGQGLRGRWRQKLRGLAAKPEAALLADAQRQGWDIGCDAATTMPTGSPSTWQPGALPPEALLAFKSGLQYAAHRDYRNALKEFDTVEAMAPGYPQLHVNMGAAHLRLGDLSRAAQHLDRAVSETPHLAVAHYNRACVQARQGQIDAALTSLKLSIDKGLDDAASLLRHDADLAALHRHPAFAGLLRRAASR